MVKRKRQRRRSIELKKIEDKDNLAATFFNRRGGLFRKAGELCILCDAHVAVILFSPGRKVFAFAHPSVDIVLDRLFHFYAHGHVPRGAKRILEQEEIMDGGHSRRRCLEAFKMLQVKKEQQWIMDGEGNGVFWWDRPIEKMGLEELERFKASLEELRKEGSRRVEEMATMMMLMMVEKGLSCHAAVEYAQGHDPSCVLHGDESSCSSNTIVHECVARPDHRDCNPSKGLDHGNESSCCSANTIVHEYAAPPDHDCNPSNVLHGRDQSGPSSNAMVESGVPWQENYYYPSIVLQKNDFDPFDFQGDLGLDFGFDL